MKTLAEISAKLKSHADFMGSLGGSGELMDSVELSACADAIDAHLASQPAEQPRGEAGKCGCAGELHFGCRLDTKEPPVPAGCTLLDNMELSLLREKASVCVDAGRGDVWYWQGDGYDIPESLSCPVVMSADTLRSLIAAQPNPEQAVGDSPIPMVLHCPSCGLQHIDAPDLAPVAHEDGSSSLWDNPPHRSHLCHGCGTIWRPADVPTVGVAAIQTYGKADKIVSAPRPAVATPAEVTDAIAQLSSAKTKLASASGTAESGPSKFWKKEVNSAAWDIAQVIAALTAQCQVRKDGQGVKGDDRLTPITDPDNPWRRAVEHAGYLVAAIENYVEASGNVNVEAEQVESADEPSDEQIDALHHAHSVADEARRRMYALCYEFTKRRDRAVASLASPSAGAVVPEADFTVEEVESAIENVREYNRLMPSECIDQMRDVLLLAAAPEVK